jgi:hypothetical protein
MALGTLTAACGDDDDVKATTDGGSSSGNPVVPDGSVPDPRPDSGPPDAGCTFAGYVINLITTSTTASAVPDTTLGDSCTPSTSQDDFKSLFP